jgi:hypothetical protein
MLKDTRQQAAGSRQQTADSKTVDSKITDGRRAPL